MCYLWFPIIWSRLPIHPYFPPLCNINLMYAAIAAKLLQLCPTLCDPIDGSPPGSPPPWDSPGKNTGVGCHFLLHCMKVKSEGEVAQSCPTLSDPMDCSLVGSWDFPSESTAIAFSNLTYEVKSLSHVWLFATPWALTYQAPSSMGFSRQEYWSGLPFPSPGDLPNPGIEPRHRRQMLYHLSHQSLCINLLISCP